MRRTVLTLAAALAALGGCQRPETDPRTLAPLVAVAELAPAGADGARFTGLVRARIESDLGFRVGGKVARRLVDAGAHVRRGQVLMRLDPADLGLGASAQAEAAAAARARAEEADADLRRLEGLVEKGAVSRQTLDHARSEAAAARAQYAAARAQAGVAANARTYAALLADADGVVVETAAEPGQVVAAGQTVARLAHDGDREAVVYLPETARARPGEVGRAQLYGAPERSFPARLRQLARAADPATRTFEARWVLSGAGAEAPLGATVTVSVPDAAGPAGAVAAPLGALFDPGGGPGVFALEGGRARFRPVRIVRLETETAVLEGPPAGTRVAALGADRLQDGEAVRTAPLPGAGAGGR